MNKVTLVITIAVVGIVASSAAAQVWRQPVSPCGPVWSVPIQVPVNCAGNYSPQFGVSRLSSFPYAAPARPLIYSGPGFRPLSALGNAFTSWNARAFNYGYRPQMATTYYRTPINCVGTPASQSQPAHGTTQVQMNRIHTIDQAPANQARARSTVTGLPKQTQTQRRTAGSGQPESRKETAKPSGENFDIAPGSAEPIQDEYRAGYSVLEKPTTNDTDDKDDK